MISHKIQMILLALEVSLILQNVSPNSNFSNNIMMHAFTHFNSIIEKMIFNINHVCVYWIFGCTNQLHIHAFLIFFFFLDSDMGTLKIVSYIYFGISRIFLQPTM